MSFRVSVAGADQTFPCREDQSVLEAVSCTGRSSVQVGCRSGGCGVCRVEVISGSFDCGLMSEAQVSTSDRAAGMVLACRLFPRSDLHIRALGRRDDGRDNACGDATAALLRRLTSGVRRESVPAA